MADISDSRLDDMCTPFLSILHQYEYYFVAISEAEKSVLIFCAGYCGKSLHKISSCGTCLKTFITKKPFECDVNVTALSYVEALDRGGLTWPQSSLVHIISIVFMVFKCIISEKYENEFICSFNQRNVLVHLCMTAVSESEEFEEYNLCQDCARNRIDIVKMAVTKMCNILLNNYTKLLNDKRALAKGKTKRKLQTLT